LGGTETGEPSVSTALTPLNARQGSIWKT
jgi:hypothetical protein